MVCFQKRNAKRSFIFLKVRVTFPLHIGVILGVVIPKRLLISWNKFYFVRTKDRPSAMSTSNSQSSSFLINRGRRSQPNIFELDSLPPNSNMAEQVVVESPNIDIDSSVCDTIPPQTIPTSSAGHYQPVVNIPSFIFGFALASIVGTAVRLGLISLESYNTNIYPPLLYPQVIGSFILGFMQPIKHFFKDRSATSP
jgi:hypothetical protein